MQTPISASYVSGNNEISATAYDGVSSDNGVNKESVF
jgi:hypothetical protein